MLAIVGVYRSGRGRLKIRCCEKLKRVKEEIYAACKVGKIPTKRVRMIIYKYMYHRHIWHLLGSRRVAEVVLERVEHLLAQTDRLKDLRAVVRREQRDANLGEDLEPRQPRAPCAC